MHKVNKCTGESNHSSRMSLVMKKSKARYSTKRAPEERLQLTKFNQAANLSESSLSEYSDENYDRYPESDHSVTQSNAVLIY